MISYGYFYAITIEGDRKRKIYILRLEKFIISLPIEDLVLGEGGADFLIANDYNQLSPLKVVRQVHHAINPLGNKINE
jgi:hypothetical protein